MTQPGPAGNPGETFTVFAGQRQLGTGSLPDVVRLLKRSAAEAQVAVYSDLTGKPVDLDLRGSEAEALARLHAAPREQPADAAQARGRGRPRLGVVAREVTLLPRHWDWLNAQPGGASVALRKLVERASRDADGTDDARRAREAAYHFMSDIAGNLALFEEASRALFADDRDRLLQLSAGWPADIRNHVVRLAWPARSA